MEKNSWNVDFSTVPPVESWKEMKENDEGKEGLQENQIN